MLRLNRSAALKQVRIEDDFWTPFKNLVREVVIPYQWDALNDRIPDAEPSHAIRNFRIAAGKETGEFGGFVFQDTDVAKWLEAVAHSLQEHPDPELEKLADETIDLIAEAQHEDGYLNTYYTIKEPGKQWTNLTDCHELYTAGHMMEAAVAYYEATGKRKLLDVMCKFADLIGQVFGREEGQIRGYDGHQEIELALVKMYEATGNDAYLKLSQYFIDERGQEPSFFIKEWEQRGMTRHWGDAKGPHTKPDPSYHQSHLPVREQKEAVGHAVRAVYMYTAMADLAARTSDASLLEACRTLWRNIVQKQMYITGGIGSTAHGEAFTFDYDLPNDTIYAETCASIGLIFFAQRMLQIEPKGEYGDVMERALYNNVIGSMSQDGKQYFYVNPLEVWPEASEKNPARRHVKAVRQKWFGCSCCPPNVARLLASLGAYVYSSNEDTIYTHLFIGSKSSFQLGDKRVELNQETHYPNEGHVRITVNPEQALEFTVAIRIPGWSRSNKLTVNGESVDIGAIRRDGYAYVTRTWKAGDKLELELSMDIHLLHAHPQLRANAGMAAIQRGPLVYCLEEADNGSNLSAITIDARGEWTFRYDADLLGGAVRIEGSGYREDESSWNEELYRPVQFAPSPIRVHAIPYYLWGNRKQGEMRVWIRVHQTGI
ncbi:glycoside hydrolase family 127 protein [Marinicrinis lubricantis]|uniref:Glycoside hydrolase family 127 protein n=1 Tax=Marinicrinis lubricantis TaxID=2086470 RepID=A0ABW1IP39_9BACL